MNRDTSIINDENLKYQYRSYTGIQNVLGRLRKQIISQTNLLNNLIAREQDLIIQRSEYKQKYYKYLKAYRDNLKVKK